MDDLTRWLPVDFQLGRDPAVKWLDFGSKRLDEPFFEETVGLLQRQGAAQRWTGLGELLRGAGDLSDVTPAGVILHISRCGSTLLSNALKVARSTAVLSEARAVLQLTSPPFEPARAELLRAVIRLYSQGLDASHVVLKCHPVSLLNLPLLRVIWPGVPFVIVIRDPVEIMVSMFEKPAGWLQFFRTPAGGALFGWPLEIGAAMSKEEYCARVLGRFCEAAAMINTAGDNGTILDYESLNEAAILHVGSQFGLEMPAQGSEALRRILAADAKDVEGKRQFQNDAERKRNSATPLMRQMAEAWAQAPYQHLKKRVSRF